MPFHEELGADGPERGPAGAKLAGADDHRVLLGRGDELPSVDAGTPTVPRLRGVDSVFAVGPTAAIEQARLDGLALQLGECRENGGEQLQDAGSHAAPTVDAVIDRHDPDVRVQQVRKRLLDTEGVSAEAIELGHDDDRRFAKFERTSQRRPQSRAIHGRAAQPSVLADRVDRETLERRPRLDAIALNPEPLAVDLPLRRHPGVPDHLRYHAGTTSERSRIQDARKRERRCSHLRDRERIRGPAASRAATSSSGCDGALVVKPAKGVANPAAPLIEFAVMTTDREDFSSHTKTIVAARAGYQCSFPSCRRVTIGPGATPGTTASIGVASHIHSAAVGGPRGQGGLTPAQLASPENGFWACQDHSKLVDTNEGKRYPAGALLGWRALQEARIHREMGGMPLPVKWIEGLEVKRSPTVKPGNGPMFQPGQRLDLSRVTMLIGSNTSGKTALCEWLAAGAEAAALWRWRDTDVSFSVRIYDPERHEFLVESGPGKLAFMFDGVRVPFNPLPVVVQVLSYPSPPRPEGMSDLTWMAAWLGIAPELALRLAESIAYSTNPFIQSIAVSASGEIEAKLVVEDGPFELRQFGGGSRGFLALGLAIARAQNTSPHAPTLLVVDGFSAFDTDSKDFVLKELMAQTGFQSLVTLPGRDPHLVWGGWSVVQIAPGPTGAVFA